MAHELEATGDYRVLRRLKRRPPVPVPSGTTIRTGLFFDVETTGLDATNSEIIELAMVPFDYSVDGRIFRVGSPIEQLNEPREPIPAEITALTGLTDDRVAGHRLNVDAINAVAEPVALVIAHNAAFDRPFAERISPLFKAKPWACSMCGVPWREEGIEGRRLTDLLASFGLFFDSHRAAEDCLAAVELLTMVLPRSGDRVMSALLDQARAVTYRVWADGAPFDAKDKLKARGYRWNTNTALGPRAWWTEVAATKIEEELAFLEREILFREVHIPVTKVTAFERFSGR